MFPEHGTKQTTDSLDFLSATFVVKWIRARNLPTFPGTKLCTHMTQSGTCLSFSFSTSLSPLLPRSMTDCDTRHGHGSVEAARPARECRG